MKVKEIDRTANIAWSPQNQVPTYLAAGTAAQQLDASFSTNSNLEIYGLNLSEPGHDMPCLASLPVEQRFHKVVWGACGMTEGTSPSGMIVGGADRGVISIYDAAKLIKGEENSLIFSKDKHTGPVGALDFNPFQPNLLASGGSESELYIWDVNKIGTPMTPGAKSQPLDDVRCVAWNRQVQHILASNFASRCVVWDLRKNDPIIKVSDSTSRMRCKVVSWHPDVATQLCIASEDDHAPVIQVWDLRLASSPLKTLEGHHKGVLSVAWCQADSDLLLSCGKDNRILVWNPNSGSGDIVAELPTSNQWSFDVSWCPRNPAIIASASFDGRVSLYSLMGGQQQPLPNNKVSDSFGPGIGEMAAQTLPTPQVTCQLKMPPKWLRRPCGANFGFGGKLVTFDTTPGAGGSPAKSSVQISSVVTEQDLVDASSKLETSLKEGNLSEFCEIKLQSLQDHVDKTKLWQFIGASFVENCDVQFLQLLGVNLEELVGKIRPLVKQTDDKSESELVDKAAGLGLSEGADEFEIIAAQTVGEDALSTTLTTLDQNFDLSMDSNTEQGQLTIALLSGDIELAVDLAIQQNSFAEALILSIRGGQELFLKTQARYFQKAAVEEKAGSVALIEAVSMGSWEKLAEHCSLESWKEVLAALVTYTDSATKQALSSKLGERLSAAGGENVINGLLCYLVAGDLEKIVTLWLEIVGNSNSPSSLQELVEIVAFARAAIQHRGLTSSSLPGGHLSAALAQYATLLASQGSLATALSYLGEEIASGDSELTELRDRLQKALYKAQPVIEKPRAHNLLSRASSGASSQAGRNSFSHSFPQGNERRQSAEPQFNSFNTGLPNQGVGFNSQPPNFGGYSQAQVPSFSSAPVTVQPSSQFTGFPSTNTVVGNIQQPYAPPPAEPVLTFQPPPSDAVTSPTNSSNPLLRRNRAVDPSLTPGHQQHYGYMQPSQPYTSQPTTFMPQAPAPPIEPAPSQPTFFTPESSSNNFGQSSHGLPPPQTHVPDQPGPGFTPAVSSGAGWNDPPPMMISRPSTSKPSVVTASESAAITQPLYGSATEPVKPAAPSIPGWSGFTPAPAQEYQPPANFASQPGNYGQFNPQGFQPSEPAHQPAQEAPPAPEPVPPAPIPAEHQVIQDTFENLRSKCQQAAAHPQVRRKLEDVSVKLDILYDKLRKSVLSPATLQGLHSILQYIWQYDYQSCMQVISGLIAGGSFAEMSDFMPGVKVLLQVAQQQGVYVEQK